MRLTLETHATGRMAPLAGTAAAAVDNAAPADADRLTGSGRVPSHLDALESLAPADREAVRRLLAELAEHHPQTFSHGLRVGRTAMRIACAMGLPRATVLEAGIAGLVHDVGKIDVPRAILNSPDVLSAEQLAIVRGHVIGTLRLLAPTGLAPAVKEAAGDHHERLDGSGYPRGKAGGDIGLVARIVSVADTYDAMTDPTRRYQLAHHSEWVVARLKNLAPKLLDPDAVQALARALATD